MNANEKELEVNEEILILNLTDVSTDFLECRSDTTRANTLRGQMSRNQKLKKLGNAIREYRGTYDPYTGKWRRPPKPEKAAGILSWLEKLGIKEPIPALADIQEFKSFDQMRDWMKQI